MFIKIIFKIVKQDFEQVKKLLDYLNYMAKICNELNIPINWHLPHGLIVTQGYLVKESISLSVFSHSRRRLNITKTNKNKLDKKKQIRAFMPNLIHSLDAASMTLMFKSFHKLSKKNVNLFTVHDCFATTANNVPYLLSTITQVYMFFYKDWNYMIQFDENMINNIIKNYGDKNASWDKEQRILKIMDKKFTLPKIENIYHELTVQKSVYAFV